MNSKEILEAACLIKQGMRMLDRGPLEYYLERLTRCYDFLLTLAPFQPGARVMMAETPVINEKESWGWIGSKHFLVRGAQAIVRAVHADRDGFSYDVEFDDDSWVDHHTNEIHLRKPEERDVFRFAAKWLVQPPGATTECVAVSDNCDHGIPRRFCTALHAEPVKASP